jgi:hypothetical protein
LGFTPKVDWARPKALESAKGKRLSSGTNTRWGAVGLALWPGLLASLGWAGDPVSDQIERAQMLRKLAETPTAAEPRAVLPPARLEIEQAEQEQRREVVIDNDQRWRKLLGEQARSRNAPSAGSGEQAIRSLLDSRFEDAQELSRRIQRQDLEYPCSVIPETAARTSQQRRRKQCQR